MGYSHKGLHDNLKFYVVLVYGFKFNLELICMSEFFKKV